MFPFHIRWVPELRSPGFLDSHCLKNKKFCLNYILLFCVDVCSCAWRGSYVEVRTACRSQISPRVSSTQIISLIRDDAITEASHCRHSVLCLPACVCACAFECVCNMVPVVGRDSDKEPDRCHQDRKQTLSSERQPAAMQGRCR